MTLREGLRAPERNIQSVCGEGTPFTTLMKRELIAPEEVSLVGLHRGCSPVTELFVWDVAQRIWVYLPVMAFSVFFVVCVCGGGHGVEHRVK